mmetsp:Transcript_2937/g.10123  ORF Transcript_2937/g.10123 Transcript_2937/m.10123 type:complete len:206 (+) Transcript_2937:2835-3452(+)
MSSVLLSYTVTKRYSNSSCETWWHTGEQFTMWVTPFSKSLSRLFAPPTPPTYTPSHTLATWSSLRAFSSNPPSPPELSLLLSPWWLPSELLLLGEEDAEQGNKVVLSKSLTSCSMRDCNIMLPRGGVLSFEVRRDGGFFSPRWPRLAMASLSACRCRSRPARRARPCASVPPHAGTRARPPRGWITQQTAFPSRLKNLVGLRWEC